jgi:hypothetical protein
MNKIMKMMNKNKQKNNKIFLLAKYLSLKKNIQKSRLMII